MIENVELMSMARKSLKDKWGLAIGGFFIYLLINIVVQVGARFFPAAPLLLLIIAGPLAAGLSLFAINFARNQNPKIEQVFEGFNRLGTTIGAYLLMTLFIFLWTLLLIVPGIIATLSYSMTFFILADDDSIGAMEAINKSKEMMRGHKWKFFCLILRFFAWILLCILTLGIGFLWLIPYIYVTYANFYDDIKGNSSVEIISE